MLMGIISALLSAIGCSPSTKRPTLTDYDVSLYPQRVLKLDPAVATNGRFEIAPGDKLVLELHTVRGKSRIAHDTAGDWTVVLELPPGTDPAGPLEVTLDSVPSVMRVAGEDVLYLARNGKGRIKLARTSDPVTGDIDIVFEAPDRDLIKLGPHRITGAFQAKVK
jgi:hypothetical protein